MRTHKKRDHHQLSPEKNHRYVIGLLSRGQIIEIIACNDKRVLGSALKYHRRHYM